MIAAEIIDQALAKIRDHGANYVYFFQNLRSPEWIEPLWQAGFFRRPPDGRVEGDFISYPIWVESQYLVRMVDKSPELVARVIAEMGETENARVHRDIMDAAVRLPPSSARLLVEKIVRLMGRTRGLFVYKEAAKLIARLAAGDQINAALLVSRAALEFLPDPKQEEKKLTRNQPDEALFSRLEPAPRWGDHEYKEILDDGVRVLMAQSPISVLRLACETLNRALALSFWDDELMLQQGNDFSVSWRPAVEEHGQNHDFDRKSLLVPVIRDAAIHSLQLDPASCQTVTEVLSGFEWDIFTRIQIHVCRVCSETVGKSRIESLLTDRRFFNNYRFQHEWLLLLSKQFRNLADSQKALILGWIETGFDETARIAYHKESVGSEPTDDLVLGWKKRWQRDILCFFEADLPDNWKTRYASIVAEVGKPEHPGFAVWSSGVRSGSTSPKTGEQIAGMPVDDLLQYLREWEPSGDWFADNVEGLSAALQFAVKSEPARFSGAFEQFKSLRPDYVKALIRGLNDAASESRDIAWEPLLELCTWVLQQDQGFQFVDGEPEVDKHWRWTRMEIVRLVAAALKREKASLPFSLREHVWNILRVLVEDAVPNVEYEQKYGNGKRYGSLSINTTRGEAMHALFDYANWVRRHTNAAGDLNSAPEILGPLTDHLDIAKEPTLTIRSVYSQHLPWLYHFHRDWLRTNLEKLFPLDDAREEYREVAWQTYVTYCRAYPPLFKLLNTEYARAVDNISKRKGEDKDYDLQHPDDSLAEHLVTLYWWGEMSIDDPTSLISRFFKKLHLLPGGMRSTSLVGLFGTPKVRCQRRF